MTEPALNDDFIDFLTLFKEHGVTFVLVGAHAMAAHGVVRATGDMDLLVRPDAANARKVMEALENFGAPVAAHAITAEDFAQTGNVYQMGLPPRRIDVLTSISGVSFEDVWATRTTVNLQGLDLDVISREALITNKEAAGRDKDRLDVKLLRQAAVGDEGGGKGGR